MRSKVLQREIMQLRDEAEEGVNSGDRVQGRNWSNLHPKLNQNIVTCRTKIKPIIKEANIIPLLIQGTA